MKIKFALNTLMLNPDLNILEKIKIASKAGFCGIEPWINELTSPSDIKKCCSDYGISIPTVELLNGWFENDGELMGVKNSHDAIIEECKRRMNICADIGAEWIICTPSFSHRNHFGSWDQGVEYFRELITLGEVTGCKPTIEFMGQTGQIYNFDLCKKFIEDVGHDARMIIDSYHLWRGGGKIDDFNGVNKEKISVFHISDADKNIIRENHMDRDRVMPLDGHINLFLFANLIHDIEYDGFVNIGVYNRSLWKTNQLFLAQSAMSRLKLIFHNSF